jgi:hypothetical protein
MLFYSVGHDVECDSRSYLVSIDRISDPVLYTCTSFAALLERIPAGRPVLQLDFYRHGAGKPPSVELESGAVTPSCSPP